VTAQRGEPADDVLVRYLCIGHPGWPDPLVVQTPERAQEWLDEHSERHPGIRVVKRTEIREPFGRQS